MLYHVGFFVRLLLFILKYTREKYEGYLKQLDESGKTQILTTDPEAYHFGIQCLFCHGNRLVQ
jgi:hypothetical protein